MTASAFESESSNISRTLPAGYAVPARLSTRLFLTVGTAQNLSVEAQAQAYFEPLPFVRHSLP
jgi:hypothetical protein